MNNRTHYLRSTMMRKKAGEEKVVFLITIHEILLKKVDRGIDRDPITVTVRVPVDYIVGTLPLIFLFPVWMKVGKG